MNTADAPVYEWKDLTWRALERRVFKLQKRIYRATQRGDTKTVHKLQRLLMKSWSARCLAVRKVTQDNQGKITAGVDGIKRLTPPQRLNLVNLLTRLPKAKPTRRVWIAKPGTSEQRPLGIPVMHDRAAQALAKLALEPEWEAKFEPNSYGFRPGRSTHDAIEAIFRTIRQKPKYVLDADIAKCFDRINQTALLEKLHTFPALRRTIKAWLQAGVMDGTELFPTPHGTPQGGVISPLLANIALHGLETAITSAFPPRPTINGKRIEWRPYVVRYADDLVVLHEDAQVIRQVRQIIEQWLAGMGLELKPSKTRITHTLSRQEGPAGFDFLGFTIRQHAVGKTHTGKNTDGRPLGFKTIITPSKEAQHRHQKAIRRVIQTHRSSPQATIIAQLNPVIKGWTKYYSSVVSSAIFSKMAHLTFIKLLSWAKRQHPKKSAHWVVRKYWRLETGHWDFATKEEVRLYHHGRTHIQRHVKVQGSRSPFDGDWRYWSIRQQRHPELPAWIAPILKRQHGRCAWCGLYLRADDLAELDHRTPRAIGGRNHPANWQIIHRHCHDQKTARDGSGVNRESAFTTTYAVLSMDQAHALRLVLLDQDGVMLAVAI